MRLRSLLCAALIALLAGCGAMTAQNPSSALRPVNAIADGGDERVMLAGHDVVAASSSAADPARSTTRSRTRWSRPS